MKNETEIGRSAAENVTQAYRCICCRACYFSFADKEGMIKFGKNLPVNLDEYSTLYSPSGCRTIFAGTSSPVGAENNTAENSATVIILNLLFTI